MCSLKTIITTVDNNSPLFEADITKISDFIIPLLSPTHLDFDDGDVSLNLIITKIDV